MKIVLTAALLAATTLATAGVELSAAARELAAQAVPGTIAVRGNDGWLYSQSEFSHLAAGPLAGGGAAAHSKCAQKANADPVPAIVDFNSQLKALGIRLIVVPVPPKSAAEPPAGWTKDEAMAYLKPFYAELTDDGVEVLDLSAEFEGAKLPAYCRQDAHWSPEGIRIAAAALAGAMGMAKGGAEFKSADRTVAIVGDLMASIDKAAKPSEQLTIRAVEGKVFDESSPVLILGDSHTLVFSSGADMLAENAGLCEQLALELGMPVDRIAVRGSAATAVRVNLYRKAAKSPGWLRGKKVVIWCFTCREFTESSSGWMKVPVLKGAK